MKRNAIAIFIYSNLLLIGGLVGFFKAGSVPSLVTAASISLLLDAMGFYVYKGRKDALKSVFIAIGFILAFFIYRFFLTHAFMPAGLMIILTIALTVFLLFANSRTKQHSFDEMK